MTSALLDDEGVKLRLSKSEALVFFEWLSRNWENSHWEKKDMFSDPAEKQLLMWLEGDLEKVLAEPFDPAYKDIIQRSYRDVVPEPSDWE